jgi:hypothetical protein
MANGPERMVSRVPRANAEHTAVAFADIAAFPTPISPDRTAPTVRGDGRIILQE